MAAAADRGRVRPARRADAAALAEVHVSAWRESYLTILGPAAVQPGALARRRRQWARWLARPGRRAAFVAELDGRPVGFGLCGPQRERDRPAEGEFYALYLLRRAQGRGLGRRLMAAMASALMKQGSASADCWVLARNRSAMGFYEAMGGLAETRRIERVMGRLTPEVAFVWNRLAEAPFALRP